MLGLWHFTQPFERSDRSGRGQETSKPTTREASPKQIRTEKRGTVCRTWRALAGVAANRPSTTAVTISTPSQASRLHRWLHTRRLQIPPLSLPTTIFRTMAVNGSFHGRDRFDPILILAQIVLLQACFYISYLVLLLIFHRATGTSAPITDQIFNHQRVTLAHFPGWITSTALLLSALGPTSLAFVTIVGRAKRALDFACTLLISHVIATTVHSGFPKTIVWWVLNLFAAAGLATIAEAVTMRLELRDIAVQRDVKRDSPSQSDRRSDDLEAPPPRTDSSASPPNAQDTTEQPLVTANA